MHQAILILLLLVPEITPKATAQTANWPLDKLRQPPAVRWLNTDTARVRELVYEGEAYGSLPKTEVFAYYATPGSLRGNSAQDHNLPAVVLVHGGGGQAFREWVELWARRGYAALAMDLGGNGPDGKRLPLGGPDQDGHRKFTSIDSTQDKQWVYHAVANVIRAHSLLRTFPNQAPGTIDSSRTAITGISWGGFLTCIVAGLDDRFKVAVPVYGCGFIDQPGGFFYDKEFGVMPADQRTRWIARYDPQHFVGKARMPMLWVNGTNDVFYPPTIFSQTYSLVKSPANYRISTTLKHGHVDGWTPPEIGWFIDSYLTGGIALPRLSDVRTRRGRAWAVVASALTLTQATLSFTSDTTLPYSDRRWQTVPAQIRGRRIATDLPPPNQPSGC